MPYRMRLRSQRQDSGLTKLSCGDVSYLNRRTLLRLAIGLVLCFPAARACAQSPRATARHMSPTTLSASEWLFTGDAFEGTFLPLQIVHRTWSNDQWRSEMARLRQIGFDTLILQWSVLDGVSFLDVGGNGSGTIERILATAAEAGIDTYVGLSLRNSWWQTSTISAAYLEEELARNRETAQRLFAKLHDFRSFRGWYIPHEVTELLIHDTQQEAVLEFYSALTGHLKELDPLKMILASGYTDPAKAHIVRFVLWWKEFLDRSGIDVLLFQDGAGLARTRDWHAMLPFVEALTILHEEFEGDIWLVAEVFTQTGGKPLDDGPFTAEPADVQRVRDQLEKLGSFQSKLIVYSYFDYMRPDVGEGASKLFEAYRMLLEEKIAENARGKR